MGQDAAGLIGIVGQDNQGLEGIELGFNPLLQGKTACGSIRRTAAAR